MTIEDGVPEDTMAAREAAAAAMRRLRDAAGRVLATISDAQPVAPHHLLALQVVAQGATTPSEVAVATDRHASSVSRVIDQLVADDLLARGPHPADRRQVLLSLTEEGARVVERFEALDRSFSSYLLGGFDAEEARVLAGHLDRVAAAASTMATELEADPTRLDELR